MAAIHGGYKVGRISLPEEMANWTPLRAVAWSKFSREAFRKVVSFCGASWIKAWMNIVFIRLKFSEDGVEQQGPVLL